MLISAACALTPSGGLHPWWVRVEGERITDAGQGTPPGSADLTVAEGVLSPGFVDVHCHGGGGASFSEGAEAARAAAGAHGVRGTTTMLASLVTDSVEELCRQTEALRPVIGPELGIAGVHLEGPWLSAEHRGAHELSQLTVPESGDVARLLATGLVRMVTVAPELPGGMDAVRQIAEAGALPAVGHTGADYAQTAAALDAGAKVGTHLFNAMPGLHHRRPGPVAALLERQETFVEIIADGVHVHPRMVRLAFEQHPERMMLISDAMAAAGAADGVYTLGSLKVTVRDGVARLHRADGEQGAIAGSTLTLDHAVRFGVHQAGIPLEKVLAAASVTPARMLRRGDIGHLAAGGRADLVVLDEDLRVERVMRAGRWVGEGGSERDLGDRE